VSDDFLKALADNVNPNIETLDLHNHSVEERTQRITREGVLALRRLTNLRHLRLAYFHWRGQADPLTAQDLYDLLAALPRLESLSVLGWPMAANGCELCAPYFSRLKTLEVSSSINDAIAAVNSDWALEVYLGPGLYNANREHLQRVARLKAVVSSGRNVTDQQVALLASTLPRLRFLDLSGCNKMTVGGLRGLSSLADLQYLLLCNCTIAGDGLANAIAVLKHIREISLDGSSDLGAAQLVDVLEAAPWIRTIYVSGCPRLAGDTLIPIRERFKTVDISATSQPRSGALELRDLIAGE
jgi:hypothetical protein